VLQSPQAVSVWKALDAIERCFAGTRADIEPVQAVLIGNVYEQVKKDGYPTTYAAVEERYGWLMVRLAKVAELVLDLDNMKTQVTEEPRVWVHERSSLFTRIQDLQNKAKRHRELYSDLRAGLEARLKLLNSLQYLGLSTSLLDKA